MSTLLYSGKTFQGRSEHRVSVPPSRLLVDVSVGTILDGSCSATVTGSGAYSLVTPAPRDTALDLYFDLDAQESYPTVITTLLGDWANTALVSTVLSTLVTLLGTYNAGIGTDDGLLDVTITLKPDEDYIFFASSAKSNWIKWSDIGSLSFTIGRDNVAGERPLDWKGYVYAVKKLGNKVAVYGQNGVSFLLPSGTLFGLNTVYRVGLKGRCSVAGDESKHFFVDALGQLWKLTESMQKLGYSEYLLSMNSNTVLTYDNTTNLLYICDGSVGYVYNVATDNLGKCSPNITGIDYQTEVQYVAASSAIVTDPFEICTDIYDFGIRNSKTIFSLEFGTDLSTALYAAIDYRRDKSESFVQTPWYTVSSVGRVFITAWGREFRFRAKTLEYEAFELDYIKVNGDADNA